MKHERVAKQFITAIKTIAEKPENITCEMREFANMKDE